MLVYIEIEINIDFKKRVPDSLQTKEDLENQLYTLNPGRYVIRDFKVNEPLLSFYLQSNTEDNAEWQLDNVIKLMRKVYRKDMSSFESIGMIQADGLCTYQEWD